jgi:hypothetical protein
MSQPDANRSTRWLKPKEARRQLGLTTYQFWKIVHEKNVPRQHYGPRCEIFAQETIDELREFFKVSSPEDLRRVSDGRRRLSWLG